jgi:hypothetical protein
MVFLHLVGHRIFQFVITKAPFGTKGRCAKVEPPSFTAKTMTPASIGNSTTGLLPLTLEYSLDLDDHLTNQLFAASHSERVKKKRQKNKIIVTVAYLAFAGTFLGMNRTYMALLFATFAILWLLFYPLRERKLYVKHFKGYVKDQYQKSIDEILTLTITRDALFAKDTSGTEAKIPTTEIAEISEITPLIFIRLTGNQTFIIPKRKIKKLDTLRSALQQLASGLKISYNTELDWKWK